MILYNPTVSGSLQVTGSLTTTGTLTAQTLVVQTITSSVDFVTGSSVNGSLSSNTHQFTGSVLMSGSLSVGGALTGTTATFRVSDNSITDLFMLRGIILANAVNRLLKSSISFWVLNIFSIVVVYRSKPGVSFNQFSDLLYKLASSKLEIMCGVFLTIYIL